MIYIITVAKSFYDEIRCEIVNAIAFYDAYTAKEIEKLLNSYIVDGYYIDSIKNIRDHYDEIEEKISEIVRDKNKGKLIAKKIFSCVTYPELNVRVTPNMEIFKAKEFTCV